MEQTKLNELKEIARRIRVGSIRGVFNAKAGHPGGSLSIADILACLYFNEVLKSLFLPPPPKLKTGASISGDSQ